MDREQVKQELIKHELSFALVMDRLKRALGIKTDTGAAKMLRMSTSNYANRKTAESLPFDILIPLCISRSVSLDWLFTGVEPVFTDGRAAPAFTQNASIKALLLGEVLREMVSAFGDGAAGGLDSETATKVGITAGVVYNQVVAEADDSKRRAKIKSAAQLLAEAARLQEEATGALPTGAAEGP